MFRPASNLSKHLTDLQMCKEDIFESLRYLLTLKIENIRDFYNLTELKKTLLRAVITCLLLKELNLEAFSPLRELKEDNFDHLHCLKRLFSEQHLSENTSDYVIFACSKQRSKDRFRS